MRISVKADLDALKKKLTYTQQQQIPFAASKTLNQLAFRISRQVMPKKADETFQGGATPFTRRGFKYTKSSKAKLYVDVFIDKAQDQYMRFMVQGGTRFPKKRAILVSTKSSKLNRYGNFPKGKIGEILGDKGKFFSGVPKGQPDKPAGIWERYGRKGGKESQRIRLVALYTDSAEYKPIFPFGTFAEGVVFSRNDGFARQFRRNLIDAIRTAR